MGGIVSASDYFRSRRRQHRPQEGLKWKGKRRRKKSVEEVCELDFWDVIQVHRHAQRGSKHFFHFPLAFTALLWRIGGSNNLSSFSKRFQGAAPPPAAWGFVFEKAKQTPSLRPGPLARAGHGPWAGCLHHSVVSISTPLPGTQGLPPVPVRGKFLTLDVWTPGPNLDFGLLLGGVTVCIFSMLRLLRLLLPLTQAVHGC